MILSDLVEIQNTAVAASASKNKQTSEKIKDIVSGFEDFLNATNKMNLPSGSVQFGQIRESIQNAIRGIQQNNPEYMLTVSNKADLVSNIGIEEKYEGNSKYTRSIKQEKQFFTPNVFNRTSIDNVKEIANKLGLLIIPLTYSNGNILDKDKIEIETRAGYTRNYTGREICNKFLNKCKEENLRGWLVCPISYYNIEAHANDTTFNFFVPDAVSQSFNAVKLIMPMLIAMSKQIEQVVGDVKQLQSQLNVLKDQLREQQKQIDNLQLEINNMQKRQAQEEARRNEEFKALVERQQAISWAAFDPMLIAVPESVTDINTYEGRCFIGPAWGPEIDAVLLNLHGLTKNKATVEYNTKITALFQ